MTTHVQIFPATGKLADNLDKSLAALCRQLGQSQEPARSYIVKTVRLAGSCFQQRGSAPNFQGGLLTFCTCKHQMRSSLDTSGWEERWIVGLTSKTMLDHRHWLFYLARVKRAFQSQYDLWTALPARARRAKSAMTNFLGDVFEPRDELAQEERFNPANYLAPSHHAHRKNCCDHGWRNDIRYKHRKQHRRPPSLLVCDPNLTFIWRSPMIFLKDKHCRDFKKWEHLSDLIEQLEDRQA